MVSRSDSEIISASSSFQQAKENENYNCACSCCTGHECQLVDVGVVSMGGRSKRFQCLSELCSRNFPEQCPPESLAKSSLIISYITSKTPETFKELKRQKIIAATRSVATDGKKVKSLSIDHSLSGRTAVISAKVKKPLPKVLLKQKSSFTKSSGTTKPHTGKAIVSKKK